MRWLWVIVCAGLTVAGCRTGSRSVAQDVAMIRPGQKLECYELIRVTPERSALFRNVEVIEQKPFPLAIGQELTLRRDGKHGPFGIDRTEYRYKVLSVDPRTQDVTVLAEVTRTQR